MRVLPALLLSLTIPLLPAPPAQAGPWPRERGAGFASSDIRLSWPQDIAQLTSPQPTQQYYTIYLEYGLSDRLTLGLDLGRSVSGNGKTVVFLQYPLRSRDRGAQITTQLGFGRISGETVVRPGLAVGVGLPRGWATAESVAEVRLDTGQIDLKMDFTWGRNLANDRKLIVQLQTGAPSSSDAFVRIAPSVVMPLTRRLKLETGVTYGLTGDPSMGVKLGLWTEF